MEKIDSTIKPRGKGKTYWRSLDEVIKTPEFGSFLNREFPAYASEWLSGSRRTFLKLMGASFALAGLSACQRWPEEKYAEYTRRPPNRSPGVPVHYTTSYDMGGVGHGVVVTSYDGRPIKIEGNPAHPLNKGATDVYAQASVLSVYDPDRSRHVIEDPKVTSKPSTWNTFKDRVGELFPGDGTGVYVLSETSNSPSVLDMKKRFLAAKPKAVWVDYDAVGCDNAREGARLAFGTPYRMVPELADADVIVSIDADLTSTTPGYVKTARDLTARRSLYEKDKDDRKNFKMNRIYAIESMFSPTGASADHRLAIRPSEIAALVSYIAATFENGIHQSAAAPSGYAAKFMEALITDLRTAGPGRTAIIAGERQPPQVHAAVAILNAALGNIGKTINYVADADASAPSSAESLKSLVADINAGKVQTLLMIGGNPVYDAPADLKFADAIAKVKTPIHFGMHIDETSRASAWHLTQNHYLESWGDTRAGDGTISLTQPLIEPLFEGKSTTELLAILSGDSALDGYDIVRRTLGSSISSDWAWKQALFTGVVGGPAVAPVTPKLVPLAVAPPATQPAAGDYDVVFYPHPHIFDGRYANNGWLQELPEAMTRMTWGNAALISYNTSKTLNIFSDDLVKIEVNGATVELPCFVVPGMADNTVAVALGYGRTASGSIGTGVGVNVYPLRTTATMGFATGAKITPSGDAERLATVQDHHVMDFKNPDGPPGLKFMNPGVKEYQRRANDLIRSGSFDEYVAGDDEIFGAPRVHALSMFNEHVFDGRVNGRDPSKPTDARQHKWGMTIDLTTCTACSVCVIACQAENNIPVVGKEQVSLGREMHWIRLDRYFVNPTGDTQDVEAAHAPVPCMHCENAPCEPVCPVGATTHSQEGINMMTYNRCIGTRYCSNNCPYKVRRFNYFDYSKGVIDTMYTPNMLRPDANELVKMQKNPEVTVRIRGVMEKCTYCIQRIENTRIIAKREGDRAVKDGEVVTACAQACPTGAITFGDLNDPAAKVTKLTNLQRNYGMMDEALNTKPRTTYLARIKNENPALVSAVEAHES